MTNYKCIVTLKNGTHKVLRMTKDMVAKICYRFRECQKNIFRDVEILVINGEALVLNNIKSCKFINEFTGQELVSLS